MRALHQMASITRKLSDDGWLNLLLRSCNSCFFLHAYTRVSPLAANYASGAQQSFTRPVVYLAAFSFRGWLFISFFFSFSNLGFSVTSLRGKNKNDASAMGGRRTWEGEPRCQLHLRSCARQKKKKEKRNVAVASYFYGLLLGLVVPFSLFLPRYVLRLPAWKRESCSTTASGGVLRTAIGVGNSDGGPKKTYPRVFVCRHKQR